MKGRKAARHATSDWMALEKERGISVTSSVMQFPYEGRIVNLLDTPGHADFSEDTYRVLTAVDSALMVIDCAKGVEERTIKLMEVCRLRDTPIMTFINKLDREGRCLYWIPHGLGLHQGTYVSYPAKELFAILTLESHRNSCEVVGENLGTVPPEINQALSRHRIWGMYLAQFQDWTSAEAPPPPPTTGDIALVGTHDTPTFAGWLAGNDIADRVESGLLAAAAAPAAREERAAAAAGLARWLARPRDDPGALLAALLEWLGRSESPLVVPWIEDLWLEDRGVNLPGTPSAVRPNWQRPMRKLLDEIFTDAEIDGRIRQLARARTSA